MARETREPKTARPNWTESEQFVKHHNEAPSIAGPPPSFKTSNEPVRAATLLITIAHVMHVHRCPWWRQSIECVHQAADAALCKMFNTKFVRGLDQWSIRTGVKKARLPTMYLR